MEKIEKAQSSFIHHHKKPEVLPRICWYMEMVGFIFLLAFPRTGVVLLNHS